MKEKKNALFFVLSAILVIMNSCFEKHTFYIDSVKGDDANSGTSRRNAWATVSKINETTFFPGDKILFCSGQTFNGTMKLKNVNGTSEQNILISTFGEGKATILGENSEAFTVDSCSFLEIKNFDFVGSGGKNGNTTSGVIVSNSQNISVDSIKVSGFQKAGLKIFDSQNIRITRVHAFENGFTGILTGEVYHNPVRFESKNIYIGYCTTENNPGDPTILDNHSGSGILISGTDSAIVEYCVARNNGWEQPWEGNGPIGIWAYHSNNIVIQHCISHSNKTNPKGWDGGGFDFDGGVTNSVMQYNLVYNNDVPGLYYANNVFVSRQQPVVGEHTKSVFENNLYWRKFNKEVHFESDSLAIIANPDFILPDSLNYKLEDPVNLKNLEVFKPQPGSPLIGKGKLIPENGGFDFGGNPLPADSTAVNIGVWQMSNISIDE